jgi:hypothetical protein
MEPMWQWDYSKGHLHSFWGAWRCGVELNRVDPAQAAEGLSPLDRIVQNLPVQRQVGRAGCQKTALWCVRRLG